MKNVGECALEIKDISKSFSGDRGTLFPVIANLTFKVGGGSIVALLGASGCGKTTLLRMTSSQDLLFSGSIHSSIKRPGSKLGFMQQSERLLPWLTVAENINHSLKLIGKDTNTKSELAHLLEQVGMLGFKNTYPRQLSGGMTQRVLLARTLTTKPSLLLLDEPFSQLDIVSRRRLSTVVRNYVKSTGCAALLVTHSVEEAVMIADDILVMSRRPARIVSKFCIDQKYEESGVVMVSRERCFDEVYAALLKACGDESGVMHED